MRLEPVLHNKSSHRSEKPAHRNEERDFPGGTVIKNQPAGASLVVQWLRICLLMQGTRLRALVWEDPTCRGATGPVSHNC
ncbi:hypothetical protein J1605_019364 [Eschrichtius robustus]|uniref:Uncharacterized protein n=1 Tax=Eschrichtius robustus TaxID=9764 RepID=A0AB34HRJ5_ESCRO|nr:hypothetical protein J1605_019364 [Eschrichtius robustus]